MIRAGRRCVRSCASTDAVLNESQTWAFTIAMRFGRLELFTLLVVLTLDFWWQWV